jgi:endonuclease YncB( thermonuclease family)
LNVPITYFNQAFHFLFIVLSFTPVPVAIADITGYALVQNDSSLKVDGRTIWLYGIYIPPTEITCRTLLQPKRCAPRASLALDFKIQGFVHCEEKGVNEDSSINAVCYADYTSVSKGEDLAAYLLEQGWAVALPDAPFEYHVLEEIARNRGFGIWGFF